MRVVTGRSASRLYRIAATCAAITLSQNAWASLTFNVDPNGWPNTAQRDAAVNSMQSAVNRYNAYGDFGNYNIHVYFNAGIPTAQSDYLGSIGFGGTYPNERVSMHEMGHYLGSGTYGTPWDGNRGEALIDQFDGLEATLNGDTQHFWPYGLNYDSEGAEINRQRQVAMIYAERADMGIGSQAQPSSATSATMIASDLAGESAFNYATSWSNAHFAQPTTNYSTGNFSVRTPASGNSFTFAGESLTVNNTNGAAGGLLYYGGGMNAVTSFKNLNLNGGYVRHASTKADIFRLAGNVTVTGTPTINSNQGVIALSASVGGSGGLIKAGVYPVNLSGTGSYSGNTSLTAGTLRIEQINPIASYTFDNASGSTVPNNGTGGGAMNGTLANGATIVAGGQTGNAVSLANGASVDINNGIANLSYNNNWTVSAWVKTTTAGASILSKSDGGWNNGNTVFYLGDGTAGGSGSVPSAVRYGGGFFQGSSTSKSVTDGAWHQVTYTNSAGNYSIYVDGTFQSLSTGNNAFANSDISSIVRLGATTNTFAGDGTLNFNGLLDNVKLYDHALSASQIAATYQGQNTYGSLPSSSNVTIGAQATLDINGTRQMIGSLDGPKGGAVALGNGRLIVNSAADSQYLGSIAGVGGSIEKQGTGVLTLGGPNSFTGSTTIIGGTLRLDTSAGATIANGAVANYTFDNVTAQFVLNSGYGGTPMTGTLNGSATIVPGGHSGNAVQLSGGASVNINNAITDLSNINDWTISAWVKTTTPGGSILSKGDGTTWASGNTVFYLGSGAGGGSGGIPSGVRNAGGFFQGSVNGTSVTDGTWRQVTYVNAAGVYSIYVDGVAQPLSSGNAGFASVDIGTIIRLGVSTSTVAQDGTSNFNGLLDDVQFYGRALSADQISALYSGLALGPLPATTDVSIASGATLDVNGVVQQIAMLNGPTGSAVTLGSGRLILNSNLNAQFAGVISGAGSITKKGTNTVTLSGANTYTGETVIQGGTLVVGAAAQASVIGEGTAGADLQAGKLVLDYTGGASPASAVLAILDAGYAQSSRFSVGRLRDTTLPAGRLIGWREDPATQTITILVTLPGDTNLDRSVNFNDLVVLAQNYQGGDPKVWSQGDFNYDGVVNFNDLVSLAQNYNSTATFQSDWVLAASMVPEPTSIVSVSLLAMISRRRRRVLAAGV